MKRVSAIPGAPEGLRPHIASGAPSPGFRPVHPGPSIITFPLSPWDPPKWGNSHRYRRKGQIRTQPETFPGRRDAKVCQDHLRARTAGAGARQPTSQERKSLPGTSGSWTRRKMAPTSPQVKVLTGEPPPLLCSPSFPVPSSPCLDIITSILIACHTHCFKQKHHLIYPSQRL